jgi:hypothetical protein
MLSEQAKQIFRNGAESEIERVIRKTTQDLMEYCRNKDWAGYDPYDGLNSRLFRALPFSNKRLPRLAFIQLMKRLPFNLRPLFLISPEQNPKGLAVFSSALLNLAESGSLDDDEMIKSLLQKMIDLRTPRSAYHCWGYNFDWQNRIFFLPRFSPNIICTTFAGNTLLDAYSRFSDIKYLNMAVSAGNFLLNGLYISGSGDEICFSYTPYERDYVHNANLLGAAYLARLYSITGKKNFLEPASAAVRFTVRRQQADGSWPYGENKIQQWTDNFHTGYNLLALKRFSEYTGTTEYNENIRKGFSFYLNNFFTEEGLPKYYHNSLYPIDIHSISQSIITLVEFRELDEGNIDLALNIFAWALKEMKSEEGYFYFQIQRHYKNRIPYARWSQAWMLLSLSVLDSIFKSAEGITRAA